MNPWLFLFVWISAQSMQIILGVLGAVKETRDPPDRYVPLILSAIGAIIPVLTLVLFLRVFVIGHSSNVAQLAGEDGFELWRLWCHSWPLMFFGNPVSFFIEFASCFLPPFKNPPSYWGRILGIIASGCATHVTLKYFPDA